MLTLALAKGRILAETEEQLRKAGFTPPEDMLSSRKLVYFDMSREIRYLLVKPSDVPVWVEHGGADMGIVGKDVLHEAEPDLYELLDLAYGVCRVVVAGTPHLDLSMVSRVATSYPRYATDYFRERGRQVELIELGGSVELAPLIGLADCIVDLVQTGQTLRDNGLVALDEIGTVSARLVANRRSYQLRAPEVDEIQTALRQATQGGTSR